MKKTYNPKVTFIALLVINAVLFLVVLIAFISYKVNFNFYDYQFSTVYILYALAIMFLILIFVLVIHLLLTIIIKQKCLYFKITSIIAFPLVVLVVFPIFSLSVAYNCVNTYESCQDNRIKSAEIAEYSLLNLDSDYISEYSNQLNPLGQATDFRETAILKDNISVEFSCCYRYWKNNYLQEKFVMPDDNYFQDCTKVDCDGCIFYYDIDNGYVYYAMLIDDNNSFFFSEYSTNQDESVVSKDDFIQKSLLNHDNIINDLN